MQLMRMFSTDAVKGTRNYLNSQKKYELIRTFLYFGISLSLLIAGYIQTHGEPNLLTIVAVLGCLPASKSLVEAIMFLRYKSCDPAAAEEIAGHEHDLGTIYDCVFTSYKQNFVVGHVAVRRNNVCGYTERSDFKHQEFKEHISAILKADGHTNVTVQIYTDLGKYTARLDQMADLEENAAATASVINTLKSVML